jgi:hypothetical protein
MKNRGKIIHRMDSIRKEPNTEDTQKYLSRLDEEISKFEKKHGIDYEEVEAFALWVEWFTRQRERKIIKDRINMDIKFLGI